MLTEFRDGRFRELVVVVGAGELSPDTKPKASKGEYFLRGWGRSGGFWKANNVDDGGSDIGACLVKDLLSGELDIGARVGSSDLV